VAGVAIGKWDVLSYNCDFLNECGNKFKINIFKNAKKDDYHRIVIGPTLDKKQFPTIKRFKTYS